MEKVKSTLVSLKDYVTSSKIRSDLIAGIVTGSILVPQSMAYAILANLPAVVGIYSTISLVVYAILGTSPQLSVAPVAMQSILVSAVTIQATSVEQAIDFASLIAFYGGVFQIILSLLFVGGALSNWLSRTMLLGYTSGVAITIAISQLPPAFGFKTVQSPFPIYNLILFFMGLPQTKYVALLFFFICFGILMATKKLLKPRLSSKFAFVADLVTVLIVIIGTSISFALLTYVPSVQLPIIGYIQPGFPIPTTPNFTETSGSLIGTSVATGIIGFLEGLSVAKTLPSVSSLIPNRELFAVGSSNLVASFFNGFSVSGGLSRTMVNVNAGAITQFASIIAFLVNLFTLLFLSPAMKYIPNSLLAAVIISAVLSMIKYEQMFETFYISKTEFFVSVSTALMVVCVGPMYGLIYGFVISILIGLYLIAIPHIAELGELRDGEMLRNLKRYPEAKRVPGIIIVRVDAPLFFANSLSFLNHCQSLVKERQEKLDAFVVDASSIGFIDVSALYEVLKFQKFLTGKKIRFVLAEVRGPVRDAIQNFNRATKNKFVPFYEKIPVHPEEAEQFLVSNPSDEDYLTCFSVHTLHEALSEIKWQQTHDRARRLSEVSLEPV